MKGRISRRLFFGTSAITTTAREGPGDVSVNIPLPLCSSLSLSETHCFRSISSSSLNLVPPHLVQEVKRTNLTWFGTLPLRRLTRCPVRYGIPWRARWTSRLSSSPSRDFRRHFSTRLGLWGETDLLTKRDLTRPPPYSSTRFGSSSLLRDSSRPPFGRLVLHDRPDVTGRNLPGPSYEAGWASSEEHAPAPGFSVRPWVVADVGGDDRGGRRPTPL